MFIAGHSLGGGVATLLAYAAQQFLRAEAVAAGAGPGNSTAAVVSALLVAPPSVGPPDFVARFNQLVNARRLAFQYDIVPQVNIAAIVVLSNWVQAFLQPAATGQLEGLEASSMRQRLIYGAVNQCRTCPQAFCSPYMPACSGGTQPGVLGDLLNTVSEVRCPSFWSCFAFPQVTGKPGHFCTDRGHAASNALHFASPTSIRHQYLLGRRGWMSFRPTSPETSPAGAMQQSVAACPLGPHQCPRTQPAGRH